MFNADARAAIWDALKAEREDDTLMHVVVRAARSLRDRYEGARHIDVDREFLAMFRELAELRNLYTTPQPLSRWHESFGPALWWTFPVTEPPWVGTPLDEDWPGGHTHWTPVPVPGEPAAAAVAVGEREPQGRETMP